MCLIEFEFEIQIIHLFNIYLFSPSLAIHWNILSLLTMPTHLTQPLLGSNQSSHFEFKIQIFPLLASTLPLQAYEYSLAIFFPSNYANSPCLVSN